MTLGWAMVGTGWHVRDRSAPAAQRAEGVRLAAVCSRSAERAGEYGERFGFERAYDDYDALLRDDSVDVVYLATPNYLHAEQTIKAARAGKHVLVEKPMTLTEADAEEMIAVCAARGVKLGVAFHLRHHPAHQAARQIVREGLLGRPHLVALQWVSASTRRDGWWQDPEQVGAYISMARGVHLVDLLAYLTEREPRQVTAMTDGQRPDRPLEEIELALVRLGDDLFGSLTASRSFGPAENTLSIFGSDGYLKTVGTLGTEPGGSLELVTANERRQIRYGDLNPYQVEFEAFNRSILENSEPNASGLDGLRSVRVMEAILESARSGNAVALSTG